MATAMIHAVPAIHAVAAEPPQAAPAAAPVEKMSAAMLEFVKKTAEEGGLGPPTAGETAKVEELGRKCERAMMEGGEKARGAESEFLLALPLCFEGARQEQFRKGLIKMMGSIKQDAKAAKARADILSIATALDIYKLNCGRYPASEQGLLALIEKPRLDPVPQLWTRLMDKLPKDPWGNEYGYRMPGKKDPAKPDVFSKGPDGKAGTEDDIGVNDATPKRPEP